MKGSVFMLKILVADDEATIREIVCLYLKKAGFQVFAAADGEAALQIETTKQPDLLLLDIMLPKYSGIELCQMITRDVPRIFLTAMSTENDKINGFSLGADDYITKPFSPRELVARVKAVLRRAGRLTEKSAISLPGMTLHIATQSVEIGDSVQPLTPKEFELLQLFLYSGGRLFSRQQILMNIWGYDYEGDERTVDTAIKRLRQKLAAADYTYIHTVRGSGYRFEAVKKC